MSDTPPETVTEQEMVTEHGRPEITDRAGHPWATAVGVLLILGLFALGAVGLGNSLHADDVADVDIVIVPRGEGRSADVVQRQMERLGLVVEITYASNESAAPDTVTAQLPIAGSRIEVGKLVTLTVSDGPAGIRVPDVTGLQRNAATSLLAAVGLQVRTDEVFDDEIRAGEAVSTDPAEGMRVQLGAEVVIHLSKGPRPRVVPDITGISATEGFAALGSGELQIGRIQTRSSSDAPPGTILSQKPEAGAEVPRLTPIDVVIVADLQFMTIPDLVPMTSSGASRVASSMGFRVTTRYQNVPPGDTRAGIVVSQTPVAGAFAGPDTTIEITVGVAPEPPPPPPEPPAGDGGGEPGG